MVFAVALGDRRIVDAGEACAHQALLVELCGSRVFQTSSAMRSIQPASMKR
jgi:hypothetical protein